MSVELMPQVGETWLVRMVPRTEIRIAVVTDTAGCSPLDAYGKTVWVQLRGTSGPDVPAWLFRSELLLRVGDVP